MDFNEIQTENEIFKSLIKFIFDDQIIIKKFITFIKEKKVSDIIIYRIETEFSFLNVILCIF